MHGMTALSTETIPTALTERQDCTFRRSLCSGGRPTDSELPADLRMLLQDASAEGSVGGGNEGRLERAPGASREGMNTQRGGRAETDEGRCLVWRAGGASKRGQEHSERSPPSPLQEGQALQLFPPLLQVSCVREAVHNLAHLVALGCEKGGRDAAR